MGIKKLVFWDEEIVARVGKDQKQRNEKLQKIYFFNHRKKCKSKEENLL